MFSKVILPEVRLNSGLFRKGLKEVSSIQVFSLDPFIGFICLGYLWNLKLLLKLGGLCKNVFPYVKIDWLIAWC